MKISYLFLKRSPESHHFPYGFSDVACQKWIRSKELDIFNSVLDVNFPNQVEPLLCNISHTNSLSVISFYDEGWLVSARRYN